MAKILAACLNCQHGPTIEPCGVCDSCISIARASSLDVIEMDAASNNSVDDIRELRESVAYAPVSGRRKVYILDEAHMLSTAAWNAFLKTLEEPPPNTLFVLATTEAQKVPPTVVDRCHRFDFQRPTVEQIAGVLRRTAEQEGIEIPREALAAIARSATGSFRDALGTLEQIVTYSGTEVALEDVLAVLGVADSHLLEETVDAVARGDSARALGALERCSEQGRDASSFLSDLEGRARELMVVQTLRQVPSELSLTPESDASLAAQAERIDESLILRLLDLLGSAREAVRAGADARTRLELALIKASRPALDSSTAALLSRIERLEGASPAVPSPVLTAPVLTAPVPRPITAPAEAVVAPTEAAAPTEPVAPTEAAAPTEPFVAAPAEPVVVASEPVASTAPSATTPSPAPAAPASLESLLDLWPAVVEVVSAEHALCGAVITDARPVELDGDDLTVGFSSTASFLKRQAEDPDNRAIVMDALRRLTGRRLRLSYELREELGDGTGEGEGGHGGPVSEEDLLARLKEEFDAEEIPIPSESTPVAVNEKGE
jgi:DNA polymerase-3 subunit gamma/tau